MDISDIYAFFPDDMHGSIAVSADAVSITQDGAAPPFVISRSAPAAPAPVLSLDEDVKYYLDQEQSLADMLVSGPRMETPPPTAPPVDPRPADPEIAPKLSLFQRLTNFFTRSK